MNFFKSAHAAGVSIAEDTANRVFMGSGMRDWANEIQAKSTIRRHWRTIANFEDVL